MAAVAPEAQAPPGWRASSETQVRIDPTVAHSGKASGLLRGSSTGWTRYDIVLDVPQESSVIVFGAMVVGQGDAWFDDVTLDSVGSEVPSTNTMVEQHGHDDSRTDEEKAQIIETRRAAPAKPRNLGFEEQKSY